MGSAARPTSEHYSEVMTQDSPYARYRNVFHIVLAVVGLVTGIPFVILGVGILARDGYPGVLIMGLAFLGGGVVALLTRTPRRR